MSKKKKNNGVVKADGFALAEALKGSRGMITATRKAISKEKKVLDFKVQAQQDAKRLIGQLNGIMKLFDAYMKSANRYVKFRNKDGLTLDKVITPEVRKNILAPYDEFLKRQFNGANSITEAVIELQADCERDIEKYAKGDKDLEKDIRIYYETKRQKYLLPLQVIENQFVKSGIDTGVAKDRPINRIILSLSAPKEEVGAKESEAVNTEAVNN